MLVVLLKLLKDCWLSPGKLLLMILASGLASWGISSVIYSHAMSERDFEANFSRTFPADMTLLIDNYQDTLREKLLADTNVVAIERREVLGARIKNASGQWMPLVLYGVEDLREMQLDVFRVLDTIPGKTPRVLIETNAKAFLDPTHENIEVQLPGAGEITWEIGGTSHDARLAPARMERTVFAHATSIDILQPYLPEGRRRLLIETNAGADLKTLQDIADRLQLIVEKEGGEILLRSIPEPGKHIHQNIVDGIAFLQVSGGLLLTLLGIILLSLILLTWVHPRIRDIGVMKALGASTTHIFYGYLIVLTMINGIGLAVGIPLGYNTAVFYNKAVAFIQNFEPVNTLFSLPLHLLVVLIALVTPLLFAALTIAGAAKTTVSQAMNRTFYTPGKKLFRGTQNTIRGILLKYSLNNLFRNGPRTLLTIVLIAVGIGVYFAGSNLEYAVQTELTQFASTAKYDVRVRFGQDMKKEDIDCLRKLPFVKQVQPMTDRTVSYQPPLEPFRETRSVRFLSKEHRLDSTFILKGQVDPECQNCIYVCGEGLRQQFENHELGAIIELSYPSGEVKSYTYAGILKDMAAIGAPFFVFDDQAVDTFNAVAIEIEAGYPYRDVVNGIDDALLENGIDLAGMLHVEMRMAQLQGHLEPTYFIIKVTGGITILLGLIGLLIVLNLSVQERTRELGIIKSLGGTVDKITRLFLREFLLINLLAIIAGLLLALPITAALCKVLSETVLYHRIQPAIDLRLIGVTFGLVLLVQMLLIMTMCHLTLGRQARKLLGYRF